MTERTTEPTTERRLERIRQRHAEATEPNWTLGCNRTRTILKLIEEHGLGWERTRQDVRLLLRSRNDLAVVLAHVAALEAERDAALEVLAAVESVLASAEEARGGYSGALVQVRTLLAQHGKSDEAIEPIIKEDLSADPLHHLCVDCGIPIEHAPAGGLATPIGPVCIKCWGG